MFLRILVFALLMSSTKWMRETDAWKLEVHILENVTLSEPNVNVFGAENVVAVAHRWSLLSRLRFGAAGGSGCDKQDRNDDHDDKGGTPSALDGHRITRTDETEEVGRQRAHLA